jgi:hypothetical protein
VNEARGLPRRPWRQSLSDEEFLFLRLFRLLDEVQTAIERLERDADGGNEASLAALDRLRDDLVAALRLAATDRTPPRG